MLDPILFLQDMAVIILSASLGGFICRQIGLSPIVGYILAGLVVGTPEIVFPYVTDEERIEIIAQLGVVFLMFSIGLQFRLNRIRELGFRTLLSTGLTALLVFTAARLAGDILGLSEPASVALAAVFMASSSAIISKLVSELGISHERHGQLAMGTTLLEDIVAVVMLTILGSYLLLGEGGDARSPVATVGLLIGFAALVFVLGMIFLPGALRAFAKRSNSEAISVLVAGILLATSLLAVYAGYSLALGAFLCGMVVGETQQKHLIERSFQGLKDIFLTVFFVTIGMMVEVQAIPGSIQWILLGTVGAILGRSVASFLALVLVGEHPRTALRAALCLTPLGEFSFIIAGVAVGGGILPEQFQVIAVGTVLATSLLSPLLAAQGARLSQFLEEGKIPALERVHLAYSRLWLSGGSARKGSLWSLLRKRLIQVAIEILVVSTVLIFAGNLFDLLSARFASWISWAGSEVVFWTLLAIGCSFPLLAVWRNLSVVAEILGEYLTRSPELTQSRSFLAAGLKTIFAFLLGIWIWNMLPSEAPRALILGVAALVCIPLLMFAWRKFVRVHSEFEWRLDENLRSGTRGNPRYLFENWEGQGWNLSLREFPVPDDSPLAGNTLGSLQFRGETGCSIVGIQRHGFPLVGIGPTTHLFPGDEILLLGSEAQLRGAVDFIGRGGRKASTAVPMEDFILNSLRVDAMSPLVGKTLGRLDWTRSRGIQVVAVKRGEVALTEIRGETEILADDWLLLLGTSRSLIELEQTLAGA